MALLAAETQGVMTSSESRKYTRRISTCSPTPRLYTHTGRQSRGGGADLSGLFGQSHLLDELMGLLTLRRTNRHIQRGSGGLVADPGFSHDRGTRRR